MTIEARIIADSVNPVGDRITTFVCTFPRWILAEVNTHRMFSRNSASSRAIPTQKMIDRILENPAKPVVWGQNQKGMQADAILEQQKSSQAETVWHLAMLDAVDHAKKLLELGVHKQIANRLLEPFLYHTAIITATDWGNFFNLRADKAAQPEFQELAFQMLIAYRDSVPVAKKSGEWHLPFADKYISEGLTTEQMLKITTARCCRVSYLNFEGDIDHNKDYKLHDDSVQNGHWSPFEHPAQAMGEAQYRSGNFKGWVPYRKTFRNENRSELNIDALLQARTQWKKSG